MLDEKLRRDTNQKSISFNSVTYFIVAVNIVTEHVNKMTQRFIRTKKKKKKLLGF